MTLDLANNASHLASFKRHQTLYVRKRSPGTAADTNTFSTTFLALNDAQTTTLVGVRKLFRSIFTLPFFQSDNGIGFEDLSIVLPPSSRSSVWTDGRGSVVDTKLMLRRVAERSMSRDALWNLRVLFKWTERMEEMGLGGAGWLGQEVVKELKGIVEERGRRLLAASEEA
jgi:anaphase-promoting complex subunit 1